MSCNLCLTPWDEFSSLSCVTRDSHPILPSNQEIHNDVLIHNLCGLWPIRPSLLYDVAAAWFRTCTRPGQRPHPKMPDRRWLATPGHLQRMTTGVATLTDWYQRNNNGKGRNQKKIIKMKKWSQNRVIKVTISYQLLQLRHVHFCETILMSFL